MKLKYPRILYFISGSVPSDEAMKLAQKFGPNIAFRNTQFVSKTGCLEKCDGVAGNVPARYAEAYPTAEQAFISFGLAVKSEDQKEVETVVEKPVEKQVEKSVIDKDGNGKVDSHELPVISAGARKLIAENNLTDEEVAKIVPTGKSGIVNADVEKYIASKTPPKASTWKPNA